ncbi:MAG: TerC family protein, partial [Propionicimonas sp.]
TDIVFAVDSIPAIFAVTQETFLVFTANAFAILGLRAMYFLLADLMHRFVYLKLGLGLVLIWVGVKLVLQVDLYKMPTWLSLGVVATIITVAIVASLRATRSDHAVKQAGAADTPAADAPAADTPAHATVEDKEPIHG